jgi:DNA ligase (NAD+)
MAQTLAAHFPNIEALARASAEELAELEDIGPKVAESIVFFFSQPENNELIRKLAEAGLNMEGEKPEDAGRPKPLQGQTFILTGTLSGMTRDQAKEKIEALGGTVGSSVTSKTTCLVVGGEPGSKLRKAQELGIRTVGEEEFLRLIGR